MYIIAGLSLLVAPPPPLEHTQKNGASRYFPVGKGIKLKNWGFEENQVCGNLVHPCIHLELPFKVILSKLEQLKQPCCLHLQSISI